MTSPRQMLFDAYLRSIPARKKRALTHLFLRKAWSIVASRWPSDLRYDLLQKSIVFPAYNSIPILLTHYPEYSMNIGRIGKLMSQKYPALTAVDIGANIGDTVFIFRNFAKFPILCIEGERTFFRYLQDNVSSESDVELEMSFVGDEDKNVAGYLETDHGTGKLVFDPAKGGAIAMRTLATIIKDHPRFADFKLLKIDTDGFDTPILRSSLDLLAQTRSAVFFEYDPTLLQEHDPDPMRIFSDLADVGYSKFLAYDNRGLLLVSGGMDDRRLHEDLFQAFSGWKTLRYLDVCVFHREDEDLFETIRASEFAHFKLIDKPLHFLS